MEQRADGVPWKKQIPQIVSTFSLEQNFSEDEEQAEDWMLAAQDSVDFLVESDITTENLLKALAMWQPWAVDLYYAYISGRKHQCNRELAEKYQVSERTIRNYKERFEEERLRQIRHVQSEVCV